MLLVNVLCKFVLPLLLRERLVLCKRPSILVRYHPESLVALITLLTYTARGVHLNL